MCKHTYADIHTCVYIHIYIYIYIYIHTHSYIYIILICIYEDGRLRPRLLQPGYREHRLALQGRGTLAGVGFGVSGVGFRSLGFRV